MKPWSTVRFVTVAALFVVGASGVGAACGGSDTGGSGGGSSGGGGGGKSTGTHHSTGSNTGAGGPGGSGAGAGGSTSTSMGTGGIDPGNLDCSAPSGTLGPLKLTPFITSGLDHPVDMRPIPGDPTRMVIVNQSGILSLVKNGTLANDPFLDISSITDFDGAEQGFLSVAFHPDYPTNHRFFVYYSASGGGLMTVAEYAQAAGDPDHANPTATQIIVTQDTLESNHNGGTLMFSPLDKMLYISWGDGGGGCDQHNACGNGQDKQVLLAKILRLDIDSKSGGHNYTAAGSGISGALPEIWDYGLRNPYRMSFDGCTADLWIGDVGQSTHEEIDHEVAGMGGLNYGWRCVEGSDANTCDNTGCDCSGPFTAPLVSFDRGTAQTIIGGYTYRGSGIPALRGMYLFADAGAHKVWVLDPANNYAFQADGNGNDNFGGGTLGAPVGFGQDLNGEMYVIDLGGQVYRIDPGP